MQIKLSNITKTLIWGIGIYTAISPAAAVANEGPGTTGANYLILPVGPKSIAMGETKAALMNDAFNWLSNPSAFHYLEGSGAGIFHAEWIIDTRYNNLFYHHRINEKFAIGGGFTFTYQPNIQGYDEFGVATEELKNNNYQAIIGVGVTPVESFTAGMNITYFREKLAEWNSDGVAFDLGAQYVFNNPRIALGFTVENLGPDIKFESLEEPLPLTVRFGASHMLASSDNRLRFTFAFDLVKPKYEGLFFSGGADLEISEIIAVRAGYCGQEHRPGSGFTLGGGFKVKESLTIDYAWTPYGDLGSFHRLSLYIHLF